MAEKRVPIVWVDLEETPISFANQFLAQVEQDEFILAFGALNPPKIMGNAEEREALLARVEFVQTRTLARFGMTVARVRELRRLLGELLDVYDENQQRGGG